LLRCVLHLIHCPILTNLRPQKNGFAQTIGLLLVEIIVLVLQLVLQPYDDRSSNGLNITVQIFRVIISGALIAFNPSLGLMPIPSYVPPSLSPESRLMM
jgi:hypothetical protein